MTPENVNQTTTNVCKTTRDEIIAAIKELAARLGHIPSYIELENATRISKRQIQRHFIHYSKALKASGFEREPTGTLLSTEKVVEDWVRVARELGRIPSRDDYTRTGRHSTTPLIRRFGRWGDLPKELLRYAKENNLVEKWPDVVEMLRQRCEDNPNPASLRRPRILKHRRLYGRWLFPMPFASEPVNEMGVVYAFGSVAMKLGFVVLWIGPEFPDCEAVREVEGGRWQLVRVEFEFASRNFKEHGHDASRCDLIICWEHNWPECPLEVVELKGMVSAWKPEQMERFMAEARRETGRSGDRVIG